ncbi:MAG: hypothetical protein COA74_04595 [Gammaproteobacteria bacterium]|nr:MAG: hypothetical protein COA74_04595 [Gammaproteobacteria bacterium]
MSIHQSALAALSSNENHTQTNDELANEITLLAGKINAATYQFLKLIAQFDSRDAWSGEGVKSCAHWLSWKCGIAIGAAREKVRVANCLLKLPETNKAFENGEISYSKVRAMTRIATNENESFMLMIARHGSASHMEQLVRKSQTVVNRQQQSSSKKASQEQLRSMTSFQDDDGMWNIHTKLPSEVGALVVKAINAILADETSQRLKAKTKSVSAETCSDSKSTKDSISGEVLSENPSFPQKRADALATMAEHYLASAENATGTHYLSGNERTQVMLHVDINTLQQHSSQECCSANSPTNKHKKHCNLDNKHWLTPETAKRLACDASLVTVLEDSKGNVLNIGRRSRVIPPHIQRALSLRDSGCQFPGCCTNQYLDAHHIKHWADGGETKMDNLLMLCRFHHRELHKGVFSIRSTSSGMKFKSSKGKVIKQAIFPQFPKTSRADTDIWLNELYPEIDAQTAISQWQGERMDYDMAFAGLGMR